MTLTKAETRQRRWVKTRIGYLESDNARIVKLLSDRISSLEDLLLRNHDPSWQPSQTESEYATGDPGAERSEVVSCSKCVQHPQRRSESWDAFMRRHRAHTGPDQNLG